MSRYTWNYKPNEDIWRHGTFDTIRDCIIDAKKTGVETGTKIYIGICENYIPKINAEFVLERAGEEAYEAVGEVADNWPEFEGKNYKDIELLEYRMNQVFEKWLRETNQYPDFYNIYPLAEPITLRKGKVYEAIIKDTRGTCPKCSGLLVKNWEHYKCMDCNTIYEPAFEGYAEGGVILMEV